MFVMRHGETAWSVSGRHTSTTDLPLTDNGRRIAKRLRPVLAREAFARVFVSPMRRARETCELAGLGNAAVIDPELAEWNYGEYEGLTPEQIHDEGARLADFPRRLPGRRECQSKLVRGWIESSPGSALLTAMSLCLRTDTSSASSWHGGSGSRRAPDSISCSIRALCAFCPTTTKFPRSGSGTAPCRRQDQAAMNEVEQSRA